MAKSGKTAISLDLLLISPVKEDDGEAITKYEIQRVMPHERIHGEAV